MKGIDPKAREVAKDLARQQGMTLGEWLNRMILEDDAPDRDAARGDPRAAIGPDLGYDPESEPLIIPPVLGAEPPPRQQDFQGARPIGASIPREPYYLETPRPAFSRMGGEAPPRYEIPPNPGDEVGRMAMALDRLSARIEAAESRSTLAISGVEQSVRGALARLDGGEREQTSVAARFEGAVHELQTEQTRLTERLRRMEQEAAGPRSAEALHALEGALGKVAGHLYEGEEKQKQALAAIEARLADVELADRSVPAGLVEDVVARVAARLEEAEARTGDALRELGQSFVALDTRLGAVEGAGGARLEALAEELSRSMQQTRAEMTAKLSDASDGRFDRVDRKLSEMTAHVTAAEQRSAQAIERMGREVVNMADNLSRRVASAEHTAADTAQKMGGEMARIAQAVEQRLGHADSVQAQAMEKLGVEIARITERLAERIANAERRSALAIDDVGEQVARVTERISQRNDRASTELAERIRQSEERTAKLLDEAREKIDASLANTHRKLTEQAQPVSAPKAAADTPPPRVVARSPFDLRQPFAGDTIPEDAFAPRSPFPAPSSLGGEMGAFPLSEPEPLAFSDEDFEAADGFAPIPDPTDRNAGHAPGFDDDVFAPPPSHVSGPTSGPPSPLPSSFDPPSFQPAEPARPLSTRDVIEQARAAARAQTQPEPKAPGKSRSLFAGFGGGDKSKAPREKKVKRKASAPLTSVLVFLAFGAVLSLFAAYSVLQGGGKGPVSERVARAISNKKADEADLAAAAAARPTDATAQPGDARAAMALSPQIANPSATTSPIVTPGVAQPSPAMGASSIFDEAVHRIEARDLGGLDPLRRAANQGYAPAQFYLAKLYENGAAGLKKDPSEARRWTERAAQGGDRRAMHNMALYYFYGDGGAKNSTTAREWFRRAADLGLVDSQYNLGRLYEQGIGGQQNAAEAYKWYQIAARSGDKESRNSAERVKATLSPEALSTAERSAAGFRATASNPIATVAPNISAAPAALVIAQKALSRLGYYQGPDDGTPTPALKLAVAAWQRDQGLTANGELDAAAVAKLAVYAK